ncbi:MAG: type III-B CRISPR module RAMP protein Cmr4 [Oscillatoria sp. PMC 1051.18]|nr:type III-B CRISPR module RAMP protein Cmr4 [Oscillatoria sp. PMC 1050.18]MEC5032750.1 type III-B CRISPR module RAMP protein Cmr4 [Oscillatoria sp. PMC 1051.18]
MTNLTYVYLLTPLHTGGSSQEGNLMGIAREVHTEFPYLPASSLRGKIRSQLEQTFSKEAGTFFGEKIKDGQQPTEGEVWFADATLLLFPIASLSHHLVWVTCPLWLERWNRWLKLSPLTETIQQCQQKLAKDKSALVSFETSALFLQTALLKERDLEQVNSDKLKERDLEQVTFDKLLSNLEPICQQNPMLNQLNEKLVVLTDADCLALLETGLQREVRVALEEGTKIVKGGSFRSEEAIPPEAVLFFPWGLKKPQKEEDTANIRQEIFNLLNNKLQFGGLEGLGRGWTFLTTQKSEEKS